MITYLIFQTLVFIIAAGFFLYGDYQSDDYTVTRKENLYKGIGAAIVIIFALDLFAVFIMTCIIPMIDLK